VRSQILTVGAAVLCCGLVVACGDDDDNAECGNGAVEAGEMCDGYVPGDVTCTSLGLGIGHVTCNDQCHLVLSNCALAPECGNDVRDTTEACDGTDMGGLDCADLGFDAGELTCRSDCDVDLASCCDDACPADGDTHCDGDTVQTCGMTASGCLAWDDTTDCGANAPVQVCDATGTGFGCVDPCQDGCLLEGAQQCDASAIETCQFTAEGCLDWLPTFDCGANVPAQTCQAAADVATCVSPCASDCTVTDLMRCSGDDLESCVEVIPWCFQWNHVQDCTVYNCGFCSGWGTNAYCSDGC